MSVTQAGSPSGAPTDKPKLVLPGRVNPAGAGWTWIVEGWKLFTRAPLMWIVSIVLLFIIAFVLNFIPFIGQIAFQLLSPVFAGGFVIACRSLESGGEYEIEHLFAAFKTHFANLVIVGLIVLLGWIVILLVFALFVGFSVFTAVLAGNAENAWAAIADSSMMLLIGSLVMLALSVPLLAAYWFAPALVVMHDVPPVAAMKASLFGCFRNFIPFLVYGIIMALFAIVAMIPLGLGFLVWVPLAITSTYAAYRAIFTDGAAA
jgi:uncharacterized membrane protein